MSDINIVTAMGRLVRDPIVRRGESGNFWGVFTLASNYRYKDKNGTFQEEVAFVYCKVFGRMAELLSQHRKGDMALVVGRLKTESWEKEGRTQFQLTLICELLRFVLPQNGASGQGNVSDAAEIMNAQMDDKAVTPPF